MSHSSSPVTSTTATAITDFELREGPLTLAQFLTEAESIIGNYVDCVLCGKLLLFRRESSPPFIGLDLDVKAAVEEAKKFQESYVEAKDDGNAADDDPPIHPKEAEEIDGTIYLLVVCADNKTHLFAYDGSSE